MKTELKDISEIDNILIECIKGTYPTTARKDIIDYISILHSRIRTLDMVNEFIVENIQNRYKS